MCSKTGRLIGVVCSALLVANASANDHTSSAAIGRLSDPVVETDGKNLAANQGIAVTQQSDDATADDELDQLLDQDISSLRRTSVAPALDVEVSTVSRQQSTIGRSPAAVFVIDETMIRRSGARRVPDLLRMVPGLHVANIDGNKWSISSRGFASRFANSLLVQIDGRTVYTPLFGGVFWDVQDLLLDDIKRIEVIRGPGATIWGANAVNGVINVITKTAGETTGTYVNAGGGSTEHGFIGSRIGGRTEQGVDYRISSKWFDRDKFVDPSGRADDASQQGRLGFRTDWNPQQGDHVTVQGDWYQGSNHLSHSRPVFGFSRSLEDVSGANLLARWSRVYSKDSDASLQVYYDRTDRISDGFDQDTNTFDVDYQHRFSPWQHHSLIWGVGYRNIWDRLKNAESPAIISVTDERRVLERFSTFAQDEMELVADRLYFTLGTKLSYNTYTQLEVQPSARFLLLPNDRSAFWAAVSRAVRTPTRASEDVVLLGQALPSPPFPPNTPSRLLGNRSMESEELIAYEFGFRKQVNQRLSWDAAFFYNVYDGLLETRTIVPTAGFPFSEFFNGGTADVYGAEISAQLDVTCNWKIQTWYSYLQIDSEVAPTSNRSADETSKATPINQAFLMSSWQVSPKIETDLITHYVDNVRAFGIPNYIDLDLRCAYQATRNAELTIVGQNLLDSHRVEYTGSPFTGEIGTEVPRGVYGMCTLRY